MSRRANCQTQLSVNCSKHHRRRHDAPHPLFADHNDIIPVQQADAKVVEIDIARIDEFLRKKRPIPAAISPPDLPSLRNMSGDKSFNAHAQFNAGTVWN